MQGKSVSSGSTKPRFGIDLGGTKIEIIALDQNGEVLLRQRCPTPVGDYPATIAAVAGLVEAAERSIGTRGTVGVGMPGSLSRSSGLVKNANSIVLNGKPLKADLQRLLGREIRLENDANCFAISEATDGAGQNLKAVFGVILGTGVGGGLVLDGKLVSGAARIAGEWGHNPLPAISQLGFDNSEVRAQSLLETPGPVCYCGRWGCVETWISGPALVADYLRQGVAADGTTNVVPDAREIVQRMRQNEPAARVAYDRYVDRLARSLAMVINIVDPDAIVLGGGLSQIAGLANEVSRLLPTYVFSDEVATRVVVNQHGDSSGVRGAAWLWS